MSKLSKSNFYAIQWLNSQGKTSEDIAKELKLSISQVEKNIVQTPQEITSPKKITPKNLMVTQTSGKGTNTVAIMTKEASQLVDELKKNHVSPKSSVGIFRPKSQ